MIDTIIRASHVFRFQATGAGPSNITGVDIIGSLGVYTKVANTSTSPMFTSFRVKRVRLWAPPSAVGSVASCSLDWWPGSGLVNNPNMFFSDTSLAPDFPAYVDVAPPRGSLAGFWVNENGAGSILFQLGYPANTIVDVHVDFCSDDDETASTDTIAVATAAIGQQYWLALDGPSVNNLVPVGLITTH